VQVGMSTWPGRSRLPGSWTRRHLRRNSPFLLIKYSVMLSIERQGGRYDLRLPNSTHIQTMLH
jgi:hypothetical protein